ncbi:hypothetical protein A2872_01585 [Candidatus Gottesmanbacteria bacterium RIFCSPHIGHO2_01_FULL_42_12]|uniref:Uncharacterized protein n=1 Tax=Candidatus Gottesmanbacteria bacterium RIFCSPHIGHO2_01_FULL_42_12 TaxID=1798377 RepID=A0A1F5Z4A1_9BACT|nr:MAG: hypothetical protein A2872_01585 [Candidatus Gottesmanbacteria bacterium RIFCSPHIGHO2_01_FULL_42_12]
MGFPISQIKEIPPDIPVAFIYVTPSQLVVGKDGVETHADVADAITVSRPQLVCGGRLLVTGQEVVLIAMGGSTLRVDFSKMPLKPAIEYLKSFPDARGKRIGV